MSSARLPDVDAMAAALHALAQAPGIDERLLSQLRPVARRALALVPGSGLLIVDAQLRLRLVEGPAYEAVGWNSASLDGRVIGQVLPRSMWAHVAPHYDDALAGRETAYEFASPVDRSLHWAQTAPLRDSSGSVVGAITFSSDVTRLVAQTEEQRRCAFFGGTPLASAAIDAEARIIRVNDAFVELLGYEEAELVGRPIFDFAHDPDRERTAKAVRLGLSGSGSPTQDDGRYLHRDGRLVHAQLNLTVMRATDERNANFIVQLVDQTKSRSTT